MSEKTSEDNGFLVGLAVGFVVILVILFFYVSVILSVSLIECWKPDFHFSVNDYNFLISDVYSCNKICKDVNGTAFASYTSGHLVDGTGVEEKVNGGQKYGEWAYELKCTVGDKK